jgi:hypothetical protein
VRISKKYQWCAEIRVRPDGSFDAAVPPGDYGVQLHIQGIPENPGTIYTHMGKDWLLIYGADVAKTVTVASGETVNLPITIEHNIKNSRPGWVGSDLRY